MTTSTILRVFLKVIYIIRFLVLLKQWRGVKTRMAIYFQYSVHILVPILGSRIYNQILWRFQGDFTHILSIFLILFFTIFYLCICSWFLEIFVFVLLGFLDICVNILIEGEKFKFRLIFYYNDILVVCSKMFLKIVDFIDLFIFNCLGIYSLECIVGNMFNLFRISNVLVWCLWFNLILVVLVYMCLYQVKFIFFRFWVII
jgi:hypothetical protein